MSGEGLRDDHTDPQQPGADALTTAEAEAARRRAFEQEQAEHPLNFSGGRDTGQGGPRTERDDERASAREWENNNQGDG